MLEGIARKQYLNYYLAKIYFDVHEYDRAAHLVRNATSPVPTFLHLYATYMAVAKRRLDSTTDQSNLNDSGHIKDLVEILTSYVMLLKRMKLQKPDRVHSSISYWRQQAS
uniref:Cdc23 domain-containing protein n=1 Tax=Glossina austeni TaxID=7395 RepID=A0A1A9V248_GLOAU